MIKIFFVLVFLLPIELFAQTKDSASIQLKVFNPLDTSVTLLMKNKRGLGAKNGFNYFNISAKDTLVIPFEIELAEDQVPSRFYEFSIYEAPDYYHIDYHEYWDCQRLKGECYTCLHVIANEIYLVDSMQFNPDIFQSNLIKNEPIYNNVSAEIPAKYAEGDEVMLQGAIDLVKAERPKKNENIFIEFIVEMDGSVSNGKILRTSNEIYNDLIIQYFESLQFEPAQLKGNNIRVKMVYPVYVRI